MSSTTLTIDQLCLSPFNVRTNQQDANATTALEKSILERDLILPLLVHPMKGASRPSRQKYGVYDGGRRYRSIRKLADRGEWPLDRPIPVVIRDLPDAELVEDSTVAGMLRRNLRDYEEYAAVARANRMGDSAEKIAETLGQEITWVRQALRLGNLAEPIFRALESEQISVAEAKAYAATEDHGLQLATFEVMSQRASYERTDARIRAHLRVGDAQLARLLRFVGADRYRDAGGGFELDLFADAAEVRGRIQDEALLRQLADDALAGLREATRAKAGRPGLRFVPEPPGNGYGGADYTLEVTPRVSDDGAITLPEGEIVAFIRIPESGDPGVSYWWESRKAKHGIRTATPAARPKIAAGAAIGGQYDNAKQVADAAIREEDGLTQDAIQIFRSIRRAMLRGMLVDDARTGGDVARDYLVWAQLRTALADGRSSLLGIRGLQSESYVGVGQGLEKARPHVAGTAASREWGLAIAELQRQSFVTSDDLVEAFRDYRASPAALKELAAAVVAGTALERSLNADGYRVPLHDALVAEMRVGPEDLRRYWSPTHELLDELPKAQRLAIAEPFVEAATFGGWSRLKASDVTANVLAVVTGAAPATRKAMAGAAASWVHPLLDFRAEEAMAPVPVLEAAE